MTVTGTAVFVDVGAEGAFVCPVDGTDDGTALILAAGSIAADALAAAAG